MNSIALSTRAPVWGYPCSRGRGGCARVFAISQARMPLAGVTTEIPVEPLEPPPQRPPVKRPRRGLELRRQQVVLADHVGAVAMRQQHLREEPFRERDAAVVAGVAGRQFVDGRRRIRMMVAPGDDA